MSRSGLTFYEPGTKFFGFVLINDYRNNNRKESYLRFLFLVGLDYNRFCYSIKKSSKALCTVIILKNFMSAKSTVAIKRKKPCSNRSFDKVNHEPELPVSIDKASSIII
jgi:hypothetical protein